MHLSFDFYLCLQCEHDYHYKHINSEIHFYVNRKLYTKHNAGTNINKKCKKWIPYTYQRTRTLEYHDVLSISKSNKVVLHRVQEACGPMDSEQENVREM